MIKSVYNTQDEIIQNIIHLYLGGMDIQCDPTYSKGVFYKNINKPIHKFDITPRSVEVIKSCSTELPLPDKCVKSVIFDPPFLATTGKSLTDISTNNIIGKRFSVFPNEKLLHEYYFKSMSEFNRILEIDGILIFKCQDKVSSGKQYFSHVWICQKAIELGFYPLDLFILVAKSRVTAKWQTENQKHARKFHSYFWVFKKTNKIINYI